MKGLLGKEEAIVLKLTPYGDSDLIVGLLTQSRGKISAFASGAKKSQKRFGGALDLFSHLKAELRAPRGTTSGLWRLTSVESIDLHHAVRTNLNRFATATFLAECLWALAGEGTQESKLFSWWKNVLVELSSLEPKSENLYELELLTHCGYAPSFHRCVECGATPEGRPLFFSYARGGVSCQRCRKPGEGRWIEPSNLKDMRGLMEGFITYTLGWEPKSLRFRNEVMRGTV